MAVVTATALVAMVLAGPVASADVMKIDDPAGDLPRGDGRLDIAQVSHGYIKASRWGEGALAHRIKMHRRWLNGRLARPRNPPIGVDLLVRVNDAPQWNRVISMQLSRDGSLYGRAEDARGTFVGYARAWRTGPRGLAIAFPRSLLGDDVSSYRWSVRATDYGSRPVVTCPGSPGTQDPACYDAAPNGGTILHTLRRRD